MTQPRITRNKMRGTYEVEFEDETLTLTSVTTINKRGVPAPGIDRWARLRVAEVAFDKLDIWQRMGRADAVAWLKEAPYRESDRAAVQGSDIHAWAERHVLEQVQEIDDAPEAQRPYIEGFLQWVKDFQVDFEASEFVGFNLTYGYAGTGDMLHYIPGMPGLGMTDIKTGKGVYGEAATQLAAYRRFEHVVLDQKTKTVVPMPKVDWCAVLHLTPTGYNFIPVDTSDEIFRYFLYAQQVGIFVQEASRKVLGDPLEPPPPLTAPRPSYPPNVTALVD